MAINIGTYLGTYQFNEGTYDFLAVFDALGVQLGPHAHSYAAEEDEKRMKMANQRAEENTKEARKVRRQEKNAEAEAAEGTLYGAGIDNTV